MKLLSIIAMLGAVVESRTTNLKLGTSCAFSFNCASGCCEMGFDQSNDSKDITALGFYC